MDNASWIELSVFDMKKTKRFIEDMSKLSIERAKKFCESLVDKDRSLNEILKWAKFDNHQYRYFMYLGRLEDTCLACKILFKERKKKKKFRSHFVAFISKIELVEHIHMQFLASNTAKPDEMIIFDTKLNKIVKPHI